MIRWHKQYPDDWKQTWAECEKKWNQDIGCPEGTLQPYNIDAVINSAYVVMGLLYGEGNFYKTIDVATRCGQDSDCNPATAGGILATMQGYDRIPEYWMKNLREVEDMNFAYTNMSLNKTYQASFNHALEMIKRNGGSVEGDSVTIVCQTPVAVRFEQGFEGLFPIGRRDIKRDLPDVEKFEFEGTGVVFTGPGTCRGRMDMLPRSRCILMARWRNGLNYRSERTIVLICFGGISCLKRNMW